MNRGISASKGVICLLILAVDTSGNTASCALMQDTLLLGQRMIYTARAHSQILLPTVKGMLADTGHTVQEVDVFAAANGPGSYTGLRIGIAAMQALAYAGEKQCAGISSLEGLAWNVSPFCGVICASLYARADLCYCAFFRSDGQTVTRLTEDAVLKTDEIAAQCSAYGTAVMCAGNGYEKLHALCDCLIPAPPHLCNQSAAGIAMAALHRDPLPPEQLSVSYLQAVKIG